MDTSAGIYTNYKSCIQKGKSHLKKFINENDSKKSLETVQKYLENMTANFLIPLEEYMTSLLPHKNIVSPFKVSIYYNNLMQFNKFVLIGCSVIGAI